MPAINYLQSNGDTLKNLVGAITREQLAAAEAHYVHERMTTWANQTAVPPTFDESYLRAIHKHLFQDIFEWAGRTRNERVRLSDGTFADMPVMARRGSKPFTAGRDITRDLTSVFGDLNAADLRGLDRDSFANQAADCLVRLNKIHPFREGNGRTQRIFFHELAKAAGHRLDFSVASPKRIYAVSIRANDHDDPDPMRRLFREIATPGRIEALRIGLVHLSTSNVHLPDAYVSTTEPGHAYRDLQMLGTAGNNFIASTNTAFVVGWRNDLPAPEPAAGQQFAIDKARARFPSRRPSVRSAGLNAPTLRSAAVAGSKGVARRIGLARQRRARQRRDDKPETGVLRSRSQDLKQSQAE